MPNLLAIAVDGVIYASWLFLVAAGLTVIYGVMRILNMAHGSFYALGAYTAATAIGWYYVDGTEGSVLVAFCLLIGSAMLVGLVAGLLVERGLLRFMYGRDEVLMLIVTYATLLILEDVVKLVWGVQPQFAFAPYLALGRMDIGALTVARYDLLLVGLAALVGAVLWFWLERTHQGKLLRAIIHDREIATAMGVNVTRMFTLTFIVGAGLGALAGAFTAPGISVVPGIGIEVIIIAFAVVVTGGLGSIAGALVGALIVGLTRATAVHTVPQLELFIVYAVMASVLIVRPHGLFGRPPARSI